MLDNDSILFLVFVFPFAVILTVLVTISNIILLKNEGKRWTNMLGVILRLRGLVLRQKLIIGLMLLYVNLWRRWFLRKRIIL